MTRPDDSELAEYALGMLDAESERELSLQIARSPELRRELELVRATLAAVAPDSRDKRGRAEGRVALLRALDSGDRYSPFLDDLARHFDLAKTRVRELFHQIDEATRWELGPLPGISVMHFAGGPSAVGPDTGFVRLVKGLKFPRHRHTGHEINYVLEGAVRDGDGTLYLPGEALVKTPGSVHEFSIPEDADALIAVVQLGFEIV